LGVSGDTKLAEYNIEFSEKLVEAAQFVGNEDDGSAEGGRTVLYLSCLACEITLKALLERSGKAVKKIAKLSHNLAGLLKELGTCKVEEPIVKDFFAWVPATRLSSVTVDNRFANATVGTILSAEEKGASKYPNEIRYGDAIKHYPPKLVLEAAIRITEWAKEHWESVTR
jgi:HEPN domain-containing protein